MARFEVETSRDPIPSYRIVDTYSAPARVIATSEVKDDAEFITAELNMPFNEIDFRRVQTWTISEFRRQLERDHTALVDESAVYVLAELCRFLKFTAVEIAYALGK